MRWKLLRILQRWDVFYEKPSLLRTPSQRFMCTYLGIFLTAVLYVLYVVSTPDTTDVETSNKVINNDSILSSRLPGGSKRLRKHSFLYIKDLSAEGGPKDPSLLADANLKTILLWNSFFEQANYIPPLDTICPGYPCRFTNNRSVQADAIIVHLRNINEKDVPKRTSRNQIFALLNAEAPPHSPPLPQTFNDIFNWTITYRSDADVPLTQSFEPKYRYESINRNFRANKTRMAAWFVSHCSTASERETLVTELAKHGIHTDIVGTCGSMKCSRDERSNCYQQFSKDYLFYLSFENSICKDYVTEKLFNVLEHGDMVPVVLGGADYSKVAPPGSYINVGKFASVAQLASYLQIVANDADLYNSYHQWRNFYQIKYQLHYACRFCAKLHTKYRRRMIQDFNKYWHTNTCHGDWKKAFKF